MSTWEIGIYYPKTNHTLILADNVSFPRGMRMLLETAKTETMDEQLIAHICDIVDDIGIMDDPDMWEDEDFYAANGQTWYIRED